MNFKMCNLYGRWNNMMPWLDQVKSFSSHHSACHVPSFLSTLPLCVSLSVCICFTKAPLLIHLLSHHVSSHCQLETARPHSIHCVINVTAAEPGGHSCSVTPCCLSNHCWINLTVVESIERDLQRLEERLLSLYTSTPRSFILFLCLCSRWGSTSQTCMRTWGMDTTWSPCLRSSLELLWYENESLIHSCSLTITNSWILSIPFKRRLGSFPVPRITCKQFPKSLFSFSTQRKKISDWKSGLIWKWFEIRLCKINRYNYII